jgi:hypothetical protein
MNFIKFVAQTVVLCIVLLDRIKGAVVLFSATPIELLLEYAGGDPFMIDTTESGMLLRSMRTTHMVVKLATIVARCVGMCYTIAC